MNDGPVFKNADELAAYFARIKLDHAREVYGDELAQRKWSKFWGDDYRSYVAARRAEKAVRGRAKGDD